MDKNKHFGLTDSLIEAVKNCMSKEELVGGQKKIDVNKNGKLDAEDFKKLRGEGKMDKDDEEEEDDDEEEDDEVESDDEKKEKETGEMKQTPLTRGKKVAAKILSKMRAEEVKLEEGTFKYHMTKAIAANDKGNEKKKAYHLDNARTAKFAMKTADYAKNREMLDMHKQMTEELAQVDEAASYSVTVHHKTKDGEAGKSDYKITKANDTRHAKNIAMIRHQKTLASKGVNYSSMHADSQGTKKLDEAFPTVADAKKRMDDAEKTKHDKKVTSTGAIYTKKYKEDEKEKNKMDEGMDSSPIIGLAVAKHLAKMSAKKQTKKNNK